MSSLSIVALVGLLLLSYISNGVEAHTRTNKPPSSSISIETRVADLLKKMTLEEKIGQMTQIEYTIATAEVMKKYGIGSVLSGGGSMPQPEATPRDWIDMVNKIQKGALSSRLGIPMIYGIDAVHGHNNVYKATIFPHNVGLGVTRDGDLLRRIGAATALEVRATGIPYAFAPCVAVCRDPRWGRCYESFSEDHTIVDNLTSIIDGLQGVDPHPPAVPAPFVCGKDKVMACAKHYVGDGGTNKGINENNTVLHGDFGPDGLMIHLLPFLQAIKRGVSTIMASYNSVNGVKMHANKQLITNELKSDHHFQGFVISDWQGIDKITSPPDANYTYSVEASINAGLDMIMVPYDYLGFISNLTYLVQKNAVPMSRIDDAVSRILRVKFMMGLFENPLADYSFVQHLGSQEHRELAREAVRKSLVLLKNGKTNQKPMLPLCKDAKRILVAGTHANNLGYQCGGWTIQWQGVDGNNQTAGTTILQAITSAVNTSTEVIYSKNPDPRFIKMVEADYAIVAVGEVPYAETRGDSLNLTMTEPGPSIIKNVCGQVKCIVIVVSGRPIVIEPYLQQIDALVAAWLPGSEGQVVADVLFGDYAFTGKLARTWFKRVDQLPMNVGDPYYDPLFAFGFGITTQATASQVKTSSAQVKNNANNDQAAKQGMKAGVQVNAEFQAKQEKKAGDAQVNAEFQAKKRMNVDIDHTEM